MTREEAITHIWELTGCYIADEPFISQDEREALEARTKEALRALGVSNEEMGRTP